MHDFGVRYSILEQAVPIAFCVLSIALVVRMLILARRTEQAARKIHLGLTIFAAGTALWASQYVFLTVYFSNVPHQFEMLSVAATFLLATSASAVALWVSQARMKTWISVAAGCVFGLGSSATLIFALTSIAMPLSAHLDWLAVSVMCAVSGGLGVASFLWTTTRALSSRWKVATSLMTATVLAPQFLLTILLELTPAEQPVGAELFVEPEVLIILCSALMGVCLLWAFAAFVMIAHEERVRNALLRDATLLDPLTDLPNRLRLDQHFAALKGKAGRRYLHPAAVLLFDVSGFKAINEAHGNAAGDQILKEVGYRLSLQSDENAFVARIGGDTFAVVLDYVVDPEDVDAVANELLERLNTPISIDNLLVRPGFNVGYALLPEDARTFEDLLLKAEVALKEAKKNTTSKLRRFDAEMVRRDQESAALVQDLRDAIDRGELYLNYQMQNDIDTEEPCGFEVLLRWEHSTLGRISPEVFIPLAEKTGLIRSIGLWVLDTACHEAASWHKDFSIAVNVAPQQMMAPGFVETVGAILDSSGLPASRLELEITEASIIEDEERTFAVMHQLRDMGIRIAMDDFGTGYSSLAMLQAFPFDKIKIDRSFVIDVHENPERAVIVQATVLIGDAIGIPILVEGVETREELTFLRRAKCNIIQGFIFGKPLNTEEVRKLAIIPDEYRFQFR